MPNIVNTNVQASECADQNMVSNFVNNLQNSGFGVIEKNTDKTISIALPNRSVVDPTGNVTVYSAASSNDGNEHALSQMNAVAADMAR